VTASSRPIRVVVADDHALFRQGLRSMLLLHPDVQIVAEVGTLAALAPALDRTPCDIVLLDLQMERSSLVEIESIAARARVLVVTASERVDDGVAALRMGAHGIVPKHCEMEALMAAIHAVADGETWMPPALQSVLAARLREPETERLTRREREVVRLVALGLRNGEIAARLSVSEVTIKTHINNVFQKLGLRDRVELTRYAIRIGLTGAHERPR
jgi:DNA-binding NarL/FixJ family response regulator